MDSRQDGKRFPGCLNESARPSPYLALVFFYALGNRIKNDKAAKLSSFSGNYDPLPGQLDDSWGFSAWVRSDRTWRRNSFRNHCGDGGCPSVFFQMSIHASELPTCIFVTCLSSSQILIIQKTLHLVTNNSSSWLWFVIAKEWFKSVSSIWTRIKPAG